MKKFITITILILLGALFAYHFIAANQAEEEIDKTIQMQADSSSVPFSVQYSSIEVSPFSGNIDFSDVTLTIGTKVERADHLHIDLRYLDFLNIYFEGAKEGFRRITKADISVAKLSHLNRETLQEFTVTSADIEYLGNLLDGIQHFFFSRPLIYRHELNINAGQLSYSKPNSAVGNFEVDSAYVHFSVPGQNTEDQSKETMHFQDITWTPPASVQNQFGFFIQGFGYPLDALPISSTDFAFVPNGNRIEINNGQTKTELFTVEFQGSIVNDSTWANARLAPLQLALVDQSQEFENVINNVEQLLGLKLPKEEGQIRLQLLGPLSNPRIAQNN